MSEVKIPEVKMLKVTMSKVQIPKIKKKFCDKKKKNIQALI